jgi:hypothetical protein
MSMIKIRQIVEREISTAVVDALLNEGFALSVDYGDGESAVFSSKALILKAMFQGDEDRLYVYRSPVGSGDKPVAWVYLVYGNDGWDVISDYTVNLEKFIGKGRVARIVDKYSD